MSAPRTPENAGAVTTPTDHAPEPTTPYLPRLSVNANFRWTLAGNITHALSQWGMIVILARMGNETIVGQFVLGMAIAAPVLAVAMLQLRQILVTDAAEEYRFADYFGVRITWMIAGLLVITAWAWLGGYEANTAWIIIIVGVTKCIDGVSDIVRGLFQRVERMDYSAVSLILRGPGALLAMIAVMTWTGNLILAIAAVAVVWLAMFICYDTIKAIRVLPALESIRPRFRPQLSKQVLAQLTWLALPLGVVMALISLQSNMPRYILEAFHDTDKLGYFGAMAYPVMAGLMVIAAMGQAASPRLANDFHQDLTAYKTRLRKLLTLAVALGVALIAGTTLVGRPFLSLYGSSYEAYFREFMVLAVAAAIQIIGSCLGYALTAARVFKTQVALTGSSCMVATIAGFLLIPESGVMGASLTMLATAITTTILFASAVLAAIRRKTTTTAIP